MARSLKAPPGGPGRWSGDVMDSDPLFTVRGAVWARSRRLQCADGNAAPEQDQARDHRGTERRMNRRRELPRRTARSALTLYFKA
jgi:hypothetical protein